MWRDAACARRSHWYRLSTVNGGKKRRILLPLQASLLSVNRDAEFGEAAENIVSEELLMGKPLHEFAHLIRSRVEFSKVSRRTATSIVLLTVLLLGITPTGVCALMCERHARAESQRHCGQPSDSMPGMAHDHSAMNHPGVEAESAVLMSQSCQTTCVTAERLNVWRKVVPQVTVIRSGAVVLGTAAESLAPDFNAAWGLDSGPPARPPARAASFSILRI